MADNRTLIKMLQQQRDAANALAETTKLAKAEQMYQEGKVDALDDAIALAKAGDDLTKAQITALKEKAGKFLWRGLAIGIAIGIILGIASLVLFGVI